MSQTPPALPFAALLLAGGQSSRMGQDKAQLAWAGQPLWQVQARKLQALQPSPLFIACRLEQGLHESAPPDMQAEWLFDPPGQGSGPMLPILQALQQAARPLLVLAVDMPDMTPAFLAEALAQPLAGTALFFRTAHGIEPLAGLYTPALLPLLAAAAAASRFSLRHLIEDAVDQGLAIVLPLSPADESLFYNANTPGEWRGLKR
ncbi:MAG: molybdenum cofactor guanylyltransferase [Verrucomicrobiota bacterium]